MTKKLRFFLARARPLKLLHIGAEVALRKILGYVTLNGYVKIVQKGDPLGRQGVESLRGGGLNREITSISIFFSIFRI